MRDHSVVQLNEIEASDVMIQGRKEDKCNIMKERDQQVICTSYTHADERLAVSQASSPSTTLDALRNLDRKHRTRRGREPIIPPKTYRSLGSDHGEPISAMQTNNCRDINTPRRDHSTV